MITAIFLLGLVLLLASAASFVGAIGLVPTDLGFTYLQTGAVLIGASAIVLAIGFATRVLDRRLAALVRRPSGAKVEGSAAPGVAPPATPDDGSDPFAPPAVADSSRATSSIAASGAGAAIAAAGATLAATSLLRDREDKSGAGDTLAPALPEHEPVAAIAAELPESDPFHDLLREVEGPVSEPAAPFPAIEALRLHPLEPVPEIDLDAIGAEVSEAASAAEAEAAGLGAMPPAPEPDAPRDETALIDGRMEDHDGRDDAAFAVTEAAETKPSPKPDPDPEPEPESIAAPTPGLVDDGTLAAMALEDEAPALAPLETLNAVGSYDSGGTRFTMYSDGSVVAAGPDGERRFRSLEELRRAIGG